MGRVAFPIVGRTNPGGADVSALVLAQELDRRGHRPLVVVHGGGPTMDYVEGLGLEAKAVDKLLLIKRKPIETETIAELRANLPAIRGLIEAMDVDLVHTNDATVHRTWGYYCEWLGLPQFWHERGLFWHPAASQEHLRRAAAVVTISEFVRRRAPEDLRARVHVVDDPIAVPPLDPKEDNRAWLRRELKLDPSAKVLVMVANASPRKRWEMFFEAGARAASARGDLHFCCIGVSNKTLIRELTQRFWPRELRRQLHCLHYRYDVPRIMSGADAVVATPRNEPLGRTIVEGALVETPLLAAASGAHVEVLESVAPLCLVKPDEPKVFARRFLDVEGLEADYRPLATEVKACLQARFDPVRHADAIERIYRRVARRTPAA